MNKWQLIKTNAPYEWTEYHRQVDGYLLKVFGDATVSGVIVDPEGNRWALGTLSTDFEKAQSICDNIVNQMRGK